MIPKICIIVGVGSVHIQSGKIVSGGRIQLPADVRRELALKDGDKLQIAVVDGEIRLRPWREAIRRIQEAARPFVVEGHSVVDELIADRRAEAGDD
jgi:AbrB family looped-hinge helix DNA binding protein